MAYQTFDGVRGDSDSPAKLQRLALPENLSEKSLLDIGCNEGFFCREAINRGATKVVGVDTNEAVLKAARARVPQATFHCTSWWDMPFGKFDYILFLSAIHYEKDQRRLLSHLRNFLTETGTLILECGVYPDWDARKTYILDRHDGLFTFPSFRTLLEEDLAPFSVRDIGPSVQQNGDPVPRYVFHCKAKRPVVIIITGAPGSGKTALAREFSAKGIPTIFSDFFYASINSIANENPFSKQWQYFNSIYDDRMIDAFLARATADDKEGEINDLILSRVNRSNPVTIIEGFQFSIGGYLHDIRTKLTAMGFDTKVLNV